MLVKYMYMNPSNMTCIKLHIKCHKCYICYWYRSYKDYCTDGTMQVYKKKLELHKTKLITTVHNVLQS